MTQSYARSIRGRPPFTLCARVMSSQKASDHGGMFSRSYRGMSFNSPGYDRAHGCTALAGGWYSAYASRSPELMSKSRIGAELSARSRGLALGTKAPSPDGVPATPGSRSGFHSSSDSSDSSSSGSSEVLGSIGVPPSSCAP